MTILKELFSNQLFWGFLVGFTLCVLSLYSHFKTKMELKRLKGHLSDKLEIEAEKAGEMKNKLETLRTENENLRMKINSGRVQNDKLDLERELEIFARAEKAMTLNAPGFAQALGKGQGRSRRRVARRGTRQEHSPPDLSPLFHEDGRPRRRSGRSPPRKRLGQQRQIIGQAGQLIRQVRRTLEIA